MKTLELQTRAEGSDRQWRGHPGFGFRAETIDEAGRSVEVTATTEDPVMMFTWLGTYKEILVMSGARFPAQVPLIDSHDRFTVKNVLGSFQDIRIEGSRMVGRVVFSRTADGDDAFIKVKEGHLTDFSVGYIVEEYEDVKEGKKFKHGGKTYEGPCRVSTAWELKELSICPIGADPKAKARGDNEGETMNIEELAKRIAELESLAKRLAEQEAELDALRAKLARAEAEEEEKKKSKKAAKASKADDGEDDEGKDDGEEDEEKGDEEEDEAKDGRETGKKALTPEAAVTRERNRVTLIDSLCRTYPEGAHLRQSLIESGASVNRARAAILEAMRFSNSYGPGVEPAVPGGTAGGDVRVIRDAQETFRAQAADGLMLRCGRKPEKPVPGHERYAGLTLLDMARECLRQMGAGYISSSDAVVRRALSTSDLPLLLEDVSRRNVLRGFEEAPETYPTWTFAASVPDFKINTLVSHAIDNTVHPLTQNEEYINTKMVEEAERYSIDTYGVMFHIGRQAIINDDLSSLTDVPAELGAGIQRKIGDLVYKVFLDNPVMGDEKALFHADHKNISAFGPNGIPTVAKLAAAIKTMRDQMDQTGTRRLNIQPQFLLMPVNLEMPAETFFRSEFIGTQAEPNIRNIYADYRQRIYEPRLEDMSPDIFYLVGPTNRTVQVAFLNGQRVPYLQSTEHFNIDGVSFKVRFDFGVKAISYRAFVKCTKE